MSDAALLESLRRRALDEVRGAIRTGPVALLGFPNYGNPGDSAIWLGALVCLAASGHARLAYTSDHRTFDERMLRRALPGGGTILLTGGGNLGDLWPHVQAFRERVVRALPDYSIVQLPQTIHFATSEALARARMTLGSHPDLLLFARDARSLAIATEQLGCRSRLCPDLALCLTMKTEPALSADSVAGSLVDTLYLFRTDHERGDLTGTAERPPVQSQTMDWASDVPSALKRVAHVAEIVMQSPTVTTPPPIGARLGRRFLSACYPALARQRVRHASQVLRSARVVVTDRLHGHLLGLLLGVPHVLLGDRNGKVRAFVDTWTASASLMRWADTTRQADILAGELLSLADSSPT